MHHGRQDNFDAARFQLPGIQSRHIVLDSTLDLSGSAFCCSIVAAESGCLFQANMTTGYNGVAVHIKWLRTSVLVELKLALHAPLNITRSASCCLFPPQALTMMHCRSQWWTAGHSDVLQITVMHCRSQWWKQHVSST